MATLAVQLDRLLVVRGTTAGFELFIIAAVGVILPLLMVPGRGVMIPWPALRLLPVESPLRRTGMNGDLGKPLELNDGDGVLLFSSMVDASIVQKVSR